MPLRARVVLLAGLTPIFAALVVYSQTWAFIWDEGFHLIAAQLIANGKRPYIDFCFPQTPLNAYLNAVYLLVWGNNWRPVHLGAAIYMCAAVWMVADFVQSRLPADRWRTPCAFAAAVLFGLNSVVVQFGPAAQAYGIAMLFGTAAFRAALPAVNSRRMGFAFLAGLCAGGAAACTLLTAPIPAVLLAWLLLCNCGGSRGWKAAAYLVGCGVPFAPVFWLYAQGPKQTWFNVVQYQALFRRTNWGDANLHDMDALTNWVASPEALMLLVFFVAACAFLWRERKSNWTTAWREFVLAAALSVALVLFISTAHPTFERYYSVGVPFLGITSALGLYVVGSRLATPRHAWLSCGLVITLGSCILLRSLFDRREDDHWSDYEDVAQSVSEVTPLGAKLYADELVFFLLQRDPPEGLEFSYAELLELPREQEKLYHLLSVKEIKQEMYQGQFATMQVCRQSVLDILQPGKYFRKHTEPNDCDLFWEPTGTGSAAKR